MLRQFHYIDQNGKDQGINVRNRAQELAKLLNDVDAIRTERKKARSNRNKFGGVEGGSGLSGGMSSGSRYGGFGSEDANFGSYSGRVYGDGGGFGGNETGFSDTQRRGERFEEYDEGEDERPAPARRPSAGRRQASINTIKRDAGKAAAPKKEPEADLFDFSEEPESAALGKAPATDDFGTFQSSGAGGDDDFDDFQSATPAPAATTSALSALSPPPATTSTTSASTQFAAPQPVSAAKTSNLNDLFSTTSPAPPSSSGLGSISSPISNLASPPISQAAKSQTFSSGPNYFGSVQSQPSGTPLSNRPSITASQLPSYNSSTSASTLGKPDTATKTGSGSDAFSSLWSSASTGAGLTKTPSTKGPALASMAKAKSSAGIWGTPGASTPPLAQSRPAAPTPNMAAAGQTGKTSGNLGNGLDDLLG